MQRAKAAKMCVDMLLQPNANETVAVKKVEVQTILNRSMSDSFGRGFALNVTTNTTKRVPADILWVVRETHFMQAFQQRDESFELQAVRMESSSVDTIDKTPWATAAKEDWTGNATNLVAEIQCQMGLPFSLTCVYEAQVKVVSGITAIWLTVFVNRPAAAFQALLTLRSTFTCGSSA
ncbi:hypothetical protein CLOM_g4288 [Closterium sp. NIES-68]|nr:hypothetical protein CLOM_g4288 [Closterium sp. NIES-68]